MRRFSAQSEKRVIAKAFILLSQDDTVALHRDVIEVLCLGLWLLLLLLPIDILPVFPLLDFAGGLLLLTSLGSLVLPRLQVRPLIAYTFILPGRHGISAKTKCREFVSREHLLKVGLVVGRRVCRVRFLLSLWSGSPSQCIEGFSQGIDEVFVGSDISLNLGVAIVGHKLLESLVSGRSCPYH